MWAFLRSAQQWMAGTRLIRRLADALFRNRVRRRAAELDHLSVARCQQHTLLGLVHRAHTTRFGRAHDFRRIRNPGDFRRLVPLQTPDRLWHDYWQPAFPSLAGATWPGPLAGLAVPPAPTREWFPCIPVSEGLLTAHLDGLRTGLALVAASRPRADLFTGLLSYVGCVGGSSAGTEPSGLSAWEEILGREVTEAFHPYTVPPPASSAGDSLAGLAQQTARLPVTCLLGPAERLASFFFDLRQTTGRDKLKEIWPGLAAVLYTTGAAAADRAPLRQAAGSGDVLFLEAHFPPEGPFALEDPRHELLRLVPDLGAYFEFVPVEELNKSHPPVRKGAAEVEPGVPYALALTSPAGVWACLTGTRVCFERRDPPLLRLLETGPPPRQAAPAEASVRPAPAQAHPPAGSGIPLPHYPSTPSTKRRHSGSAWRNALP
jgi:hypothetical protein